MTERAFFGRSGELTLLRDYLTKTAEGEQQLLLIEGDARIGKTALLEAFARDLTRRGGLRRPRVLFIRAPAGERYAPVRNAARTVRRNRFSREQDGDAQATELAGSITVDWLQAIPIWGNLLSAIAATTRILHRARDGRDRNRRQALDKDLATLIRAASRRLLVLLVDDLEHADREAIDLLLQLVIEADEGVRLLVIGAYRPTLPGVPDPPVHALRRRLPSYGERFAHVQLHGLTISAIGEWLREAVPGAANHPELAETALEATGGHPDAVRSTIAAVTARNREGETVQTWPLPSTNEVAAQLGALEDRTAEIVRAAAFLGAEFCAVDVAQLLSADELAVEDGLAQAVHFDLLEHLEDRILPNGDVSSTFRFRNAALQSSVLRSLDSARKAEWVARTSH